MTRSPAVQPLIDITARLPEAGRIRMGVKIKTKAGDKMRPTSIDTFRFTSPDRELVDKLAELYGGTVTEWKEPKANPPDQWQVTTTSNRIGVVLAPNCISQSFEQWDGPSCLRRCDGIEVEVTRPGPDGAMPAIEACICTAQGRRDCKAYTRIILILPQLPFRGVWRLQTTSDYALREIPGMLAVIHALSEATGLIRVEMSISKRKVVRNGETKHFIVPTLTLPHTPEELAQGAAQLRALSASPEAPIAALPPVQAPILPDADGIYDAELIEDRVISPLEERARLIADDFILDRDAFWRGMMLQVDGDHARITAGLDKIDAGDITPGGFLADGRIQWIPKAT